MIYNTDNENISQVWKDVLYELRSHVDADLLTTCYQTLTPRYVTKNKLCLATDNGFHRDWVLEDSQRDPLENAVKKELGEGATISIVLTEQLTLPTIMPRQTIMPNSLARSALFGVQGKNHPIEYFEQVELESWKGVTLRYTGPQLDQIDLDIWLQCLRMAGKNGLGKAIEFTAHEFIIAMGKPPGGSQYKLIERRLTRLRATAIDVQIGQNRYVGGLLDRFKYNEGKELYSIIIDPLIAMLFENNQYSRIDWEQRMKLRGRLAKFLHAYLPTHSTKKAPTFIKVENLKKLSKSNTKHLWKFRQTLRKAIAELHEVGALDESWFDDADKVYFVRSGA